MTRLLALALLSALAALPAAKILMNDAQVRVVHATNDPGDKSKLHKHDVNRVMVHLDPGRMKLDFEDGTVKDIVFKAGDVRWDPKGGMHTSENVGGTRYNIVEVELKREGGTPMTLSARDPVTADSEHHKIEFENDQVRVVRFRLAPGEKTPLHEHGLPRVTIYLTDQSVQTTLANRRGSPFLNKAGTVTRGSHAIHSERNTGKEPFEVIFVELKTK